MVELRWPRRGRFRDIERDFVADGEGVYDVDADAEAQYRSRGWVDPDDADGTDDADESAEEPGEFDAEAWTDQHYQTRAQRVHDGDVDDHLDEIEDAETSGTVQDAVEARRDELESDQ